ncbi:TetR/AcrR family transcriptional regulator [Chromobacterium vaccinii]|nr:TetR/AcrR family transcriptional regulator [Chromobacterium vaccinii]
MGMMIPIGIVVKTDGKMNKRKAGESSAAPRERLLEAAGELFYNDGIRATGVEAIAARANTTKMALYRHFQSKDALLAEWLRQVIASYWRTFDAIAAEHAGDPRAQILGWAAFFADDAGAWSHRGCPFINSIAELPDREHVGRKLIAEYKQGQWRRLAGLCRAAGLASPEDTASELMLVFEGAQVAAQNQSIVDAGTLALRIASAIVERQAKASTG